MNKQILLLIPGCIQTLFALYAHPKIFIFPSEYEAMSMALLEGLSFAVPTVYSNIPENEAVAAGLGFPFRVTDPDSLAIKIHEVLGSYDLARQRARDAREVVREKRDWGRIAGQYHELYQRLAMRPGAGR